MMLAITGGIGAGKSTVLRMFAGFGARIADADDLAHSAYRQGLPSYQAMVARWGRGILDASGEIDRRKVAAIVFCKKEELNWLNVQVHPFVWQELENLSAEREKGPLFCAIPLLYEFGWEDKVDAVISVWCPPEVQRERLLQRGWTDEEIRRRLATQISMDEKLSRGDYGIINDCTLEELAAQCRAVMDAVVEKVSQKQTG